jgi:hypothetical protein
MPSPDSKTVLSVLRDAADFAQRVGLKRDATAFEEFHTRFQTEKPTLKALRRSVEPVRNGFAIRIRETLYDDSRDPRRGMELLVEQYERISVALLDVIYPPEPKSPEMDITGFAGSEHVKDRMLTYEGDSSGVRSIVESSIILVRRYSEVLGTGDFAAAYALTDSGLRAWMSLQRFIGDHERAAREFHGPALEFRIGRFTYVYADEAARKKSNTSAEGWPKGTPKENRRGAVSGFWIRDRAAQTGCGGSLWLAEEAGEYRIAKFDFWIP